MRRRRLDSGGQRSERGRVAASARRRRDLAHTRASRIRRRHRILAALHLARMRRLWGCSGSRRCLRLRRKHRLQRWARTSGRWRRGGLHRVGGQIGGQGGRCCELRERRERRQRSAAVWRSAQASGGGDGATILALRNFKLSQRAEQARERCSEDPSRGAQRGQGRSARSDRCAALV